MFPEEEEEEEDVDRREFYSLTRSKIYQLELPEAKRKVCYSSLGWLITLSQQDLTLNLLNPINHAQIKLPNLKKFKDYDGRLFSLNPPRNDFFAASFRKFVLSSSPSSSYIVMALMSDGVLIFCRPEEDEYWTRLHLTRGTYDVTYYKGQFYFLHYDGSLAACDFEDLKQRRIVVPKMPSELTSHSLGVQKRLYLVEAAGDLVVVLRSHETPVKIGFRVFKVPFSNGNWQSEPEVKNLGNITLFLDTYSSFSVVDDSSSNYSGCKANSIYFLFRDKHYRSSTTHMGIFNIRDGEIEQRVGDEFPGLFGGRKSHHKYEGFVWIQPSFD
jgi:hypothetical protein